MNTDQQNNQQVRVRFAPSPTGFLHIGGVRTALFNWLFARHHNGTFVLRIEDTDAKRSSQESIDMILEGLRWTGLDWDEGPYLQMDKKELYTKQADRLLDCGLAYKCYCSKEELEEMRKEAMAKGEKPKYDGRCRLLERNYPDKPSVIRFKTPSDGEICVDDLIKGKISFNNAEFDDLVIMRSDGSPTYNFVVVIDDAEMNITHVIRGDDHLANTPRQIHLYKGMGYPVPKFAHLPMILGHDKTRLSKRHGAASILEYRDKGYLSDAVINYLVRLGWSHGDQEIFSREELIKYFSLDQVNNSPAVFNPEKLLWLNTHYIKTSSPESLVSPLMPHLITNHCIKDETQATDKELIKIIPCLNERSKTLQEMASGMEFYFKEITEYEEKGRKKFFTEQNKILLEDFLHEIKNNTEFNESSIQAIFSRLMEQHNLKLGKIAQPARLALTGKTISPSIFDVMLLLGKNSVLQRLLQAIDFINNSST